MTVSEIDEGQVKGVIGEVKQTFGERNFGFVQVFDIDGEKVWKDVFCHLSDIPDAHESEFVPGATVRLDARLEAEGWAATDVEIVSDGSEGQ
ncbi:cold shock domain-containing protein [Natrononativus amylolyticus]|uniref:cold shock domain-containing protein n=1 Tax=Natrononativus amylolyticus TaxID=2963434 RepID=UPI0020CCDF4D|nr:cold shock domain-containing protein [Natrononativus amylolyticus]